MKMKALTSLAILSFLASVSQAQTQVPHEFQSGTPAFASEVNENFNALEEAIDQNAAAISQIPADLPNDVSIIKGEQEIQNARIDALEALGTKPRWRVTEYDSVLDEYVEVDDIVLDTYIFNRQDTNGRSLVMIKLTDAHPLGLTWYPAVLENGNVSPGLQGLETNHAVLAYAPNSNCTGEPVRIIQRRWNGPMTSAHTDRSNFRFWTAFNHNTNSVYYMATGGGTTSSDVFYDLWEYGYYDEALDESSSLWVHQNQSCKVNVHMASRPEYTLNGGSDILAVDAKKIATFDSFARDVVLLFR